MTAIFKDRLKQVRQQLKMTQAEVAERAKLPASSICHYETGEREPSLDNLIRLAEAMEVSLDYLCGVGRRDANEHAARKLDKIKELLK